jgi:hypothetical protein
MRQCVGGSGADTTAAALAYLKAGNEFRLADLYLIGELEDPNAIFVTDWPSPLLWPPWGTFQTTKISRGTVTSKIGLEVANLDVRWSPKLAAFGQTVATANFYQKAGLGFYRNWRVRVWRTIMPTAGDANTYGAYELFGGRIAQAEVVRGQISFTLNSFLDCIDELVPPNVIENTNILAGYSGATPVLADSETSLPQFTVVAPTTTTKILATCNSPSSGKIYDLNKLQFGYLVFKAGSTLAGAFSPIAQNQDFNAGGGTHYNEFIVYQRFPWAPSVGDTFYVSAAFPLDQAAAAAAGIYRGFKYVPSPETAA